MSKENPGAASTTASGAEIEDNSCDNPEPIGTRPQGCALPAVTGGALGDWTLGGDWAGLYPLAGAITRCGDPAMALALLAAARVELRRAGPQGAAVARLLDALAAQGRPGRELDTAEVAGAVAERDRFVASGGWLQ